MSSEITPGLRIFEGTHPGMKGKTNEDRYGSIIFTQPDQTTIPYTLVVLCDGIGGHSAGEVAAELAVNTILREVSLNAQDDPILALEKSIQSASDAILQEAQTDRMRSGMGTTCACALIRQRMLYISYIGDSRVYLWRKKKLNLLSRDHTWIQEAIESGVIDPHDAAEHPNRHVLRRYLGSPNPPAVDSHVHFQSNHDPAHNTDINSLSLQKNDIVMLCSDGLTDLVTDDEINQIISKNKPASAIQQLIALANQRGGHDNITIMLVQVFHKKRAFSQDNQKKQSASCLLLFLFTIFLAVGVFFGVRYLKNWNNVTPSATTAATLPFPTETSLPLFNQTTDTQFTQPTSAFETLQPELTVIATITPWPTDTTSP